MDPSIFNNAMSAANAGFRSHTVEEVKAAVNGACLAAAPLAAQLSEQKSGILPDRQAGMSLAESVAAMDAAERQFAAPVPAAAPEQYVPGTEAEQSGPDIGM